MVAQESAKRMKRETARAEKRDKESGRDRSNFKF